MRNQSLKEKTAAGFFWSFLERSSVQFVQFVLGIAMARLLFPHDYGLIGMTAIFMALSTLFVDSGFANALIQKKDRTPEDLSTVFYFNLLISLLCYGVLYCCAPWISHFYGTQELTSVIRILSLSLVFNSIGAVHNTRLSISMNFKKKAIVNLGAVCVSGGIGIFMAYSGFGVWALVGQTLCGSLITVILLFWMERWLPLPVFSLASFRSLFRFGSKLLASGFAYTVLNNLYTILIGRYFSPTQVGYYTKGTQLPAVISVTGSSILMSVTYPMMSSIQDDRTRVLSIYRRLFRMAAFFIIPAMIGVSLISAPFIRYFLTEKWVPAIPLMQWICFARLLTPLNVLNMNVLNAIGRPDLYLKIDLISLPLMVLALVVTIPLGLETVVIGQFLVSVGVFFINAYFPGKIFGYGISSQIKDLFPVIACTGGMVLSILPVVLWVHSDLVKIIVSTLLGSSVYYFLALFSGMEDAKEIRSMIRKFRKPIPKPMEVVIDPRSNVHYASYYIQGLFDVVGKKNVSFSMNYFQSLKMDRDSSAFDHYFAFVLIRNGKVRKFIVDFRDKPTIKAGAYQWSDVYAKLNMNRKKIPPKWMGKVISVPPSFGIKIWNLWESIFYAVTNWLKARKHLPVSAKKFLWYYLYTYRRSYLKNYLKQERSRMDYLFFISRLWTHPNCIRFTNKLRYRFIRAAKEIKYVDFEGGFNALPQNSEYSKYKDVVFIKEYPILDYIHKTKQSCLVFNTPAVHNCHGWKLGEYLAMGKAILSTPLSNELAVKLQHGVHIHFIRREEELEESLEKICLDSFYREQLEKGAKAYFDQHASPAQVIRFILSLVNES